MAYINQEMKQVIAASLKPVLAKYKVKATLSVQNNLNIKLTLRAGALNIKNDWIVFNREFKGVLTEVTEPFFADAFFHECFKGDTLDFLTTAAQAMKSADWYDESDVQTDYFNTAYYWDIDLEKYEYNGV